MLRDALPPPIEPVLVEPLGDGVGLLASLVRVHLADGRRLVVKRPASDAGNRGIAVRFGYYAREAGTYHDLLPRPGVRAPRCHAVIDHRDGPVLVLDDLGDLRPGDQLAGATPAEAFAAAECAARIHAAFWNDPVLAACAWLPGPTDEVVAGYGRLFDLTWDAFCARASAFVPPAHLATATRAITAFDDVCAHFSSAPRTLVHGDYRLDNLMFDADGEATALDWQLAAWGRGPYDLALFLAGSMETDVRRTCEDEVVACYHAALVAASVPDYPLDACWADYRRGLVLNLPNPVTALVAVSGGTERGRQMLAANARRALAAVADHADV
jgi:aminoglycoside/choline kinase family phosphotransferase